MIVILALIANIFSVLFVGYLFLFEGEADLGIFLVLLANLLSMWGLNKKINHPLRPLIFLSNLWPFIFFKRLALEEKKKIKNLEEK